MKILTKCQKADHLMRDCHKIGAWKGVTGWEQNKQWGQWVKVVCKKDANVVTHSRHYFSERPWDWHCTGDGATRMHGLFAGGGCSFYFGYWQDGCPAENFDYHSIATPQTDKRIKFAPILKPNVLFYPLGAAHWKVGYGYVRPWRQSFHALVAIHKIPFQYFTSQNHNSPYHNSEKFYFLK